MLEVVDVLHFMCCLNFRIFKEHPVKIVIVFIADGDLVFLDALI